MSQRSYSAGMATWALLTPFALCFGLFVLYPLSWSLLLSFESSSARHEGMYTFANYRFLLHDRLFWWSLLNTTLFAAGFLLLQIPLCLAIAAGLHSRYARLRAPIRFALLTPFFIGPLYASALFAAMLDKRYGLVNRLLSLVSCRTVEIDFLADPRLSLLSMLIVALWISVGFGSLYLAAAMRNIQRELYDAAMADGAGAWRCFWHITLPSVRPMLGLLILVGTIQSFQLFELPYVLFGGSGPSSAGLTVVMYLYAAGFEAGNFPYASAVGWTLVLVLGMLTFIQWRILRRLAR